MIDWLVQTTTELPALPAAAWLSPPERERLSTLRVAKKRSEWLLGRWTAKRLVQAHLVRVGLGEFDLAEITIIPAPDGSPVLQIGLQPVSCIPYPSLSISHSHGRALCALGAGGVSVGADIELIAQRSPAFVADFFTPGEQDLVAAAPVALRDTLVTAIWSAKESVLKTLRLGLTVDTRLVECLPPLAGETPAAWTSFTSVCHPSLGAPAAGLPCWWRVDGAFVLTLAAMEPPGSFA